MVVLTLLPLVGESELVKLFRIDWTHYLTRRSEKVIHSFCHLERESLMNTTIIAFLYLLKVKTLARTGPRNTRKNANVYCSRQRTHLLSYQIVPVECS